MSAKLTQFKNLHEAKELFVLPNVWDAKSARIFQEKHFPAIATSSSAVANSLGYEDGEGMLFSDYLFVIRRIIAAVELPLSVDLEMGYGRSNEEIYANIRQLADLGIVGINIEDSTINNSTRTLKDADIFAETIYYIKNKLTAEGLDLFINLRCDTFILHVENALKETLHRISLYNSTGADGIFLPCIRAEKDITTVVQHTSLALNVMVIPGLPNLETLKQLGVRRVSMGPFLFNKAYDIAGELSRQTIRDGNFSSILP